MKRSGWHANRLRFGRVRNEFRACSGNAEGAWGRVEAVPGLPGFRGGVAGGGAGGVGGEAVKVLCRSH